MIKAQKKAPTWFWLTLVLIVIAAIIVYVAVNNDGRTDQRNMEDHTTYLE